MCIAVWSEHYTNSYERCKRLRISTSTVDPWINLPWILMEHQLCDTMLAADILKRLNAWETNGEQWVRVLKEKDWKKRKDWRKDIQQRPTWEEVARHICTWGRGRMPAGVTQGSTFTQDQKRAPSVLMCVFKQRNRHKQITHSTCHCHSLHRQCVEWCLLRRNTTN